MGSPIRILQIANRIPYPLNDGGNIATWYVAHYLKSFGHIVDLAFLNTNKHFGNPSDIAGEYNKIFQTPINTDITVFGLVKSFFSPLPYNIERFKSSVFESQLIFILQNNTYDFIQLEGAYMALYIPILKKHSKAKIVLRSHNIEHKIWERLSKNTSNTFKKYFIEYLAKKIKIFENETLHNFDAIVAITNDDEVYYRNQDYKGVLTTIQAGFEDSLKSNIDKIPNSICFIGSMQWMPNKEGIDWFLSEIWPLIIAELPEAEFHIAGKGMDNSFSHWAGKGIVLHGLVPDAADFIQNHRVFIVPLLSGGGMRLKVVEAMGLEMPIVSTRIGAEGIHYTAGQDILISDTPAEIKESIKTLLCDQEYADTIARNARLRAMNEYSWKELVARFEKMYKELE